MATYQFRPLSIGEILDGAFSIYRRIFGTLITIAIVCQGIPSLLSVYTQLSGGVFFNPGLYLLTVALSGFGGLFAAGATLRAISETYLGREPSFTSALVYAARKAWRLFVAGLFKSIVVFLAYLLFVIPGIIVACGYAVVAQVAVLEDQRTPSDPLGRSWFLTKGFKGRAFALYFIVLVLIYIIPFTAAGVITAMNPGLFSNPTAIVVVAIATQVLSLLIYPLYTCVFTLFYYDLRVRKEAFDLEYLGRQLELEVASA